MCFCLSEVCWKYRSEHLAKMFKLLATSGVTAAMTAVYGDWALQLAKPHFQQALAVAFEYFAVLAVVAPIALIAALWWYFQVCVVQAVSQKYLI